MNTIHTINPFQEWDNCCIRENTTLELGRLNVIIGENGSGKTAVLKALEYAAPEFSARKYRDHIDNLEVLAVRGFFDRNPELIDKVAPHYEAVMGYKLPPLKPSQPFIRLLSGGQRQVIEVLTFVLSNYKINNYLHTSLGIDDYANRLNPRLAALLTHHLYACAVENDKQLVLTTHNPGVLDGLDLNDDQQRLFVVRRTGDGGTTVERIIPRPPRNHDAEPISWGEAWMRGYIGGLHNCI